MLLRFGLWLFIFVPCLSYAQIYKTYFTGDTTDVTTGALKGTLLAGGATDNDDAMKWFLQRAGGGDIVVIRTTGTDGYNQYLYSDLGVAVNSVETIVIPNAAAASDAYVSKQIKNAEALFIAGGDQYDYVKYWKDSPVEEAINYLINTKQVTVGGTSAGMAIQGDAYFSAQNGTITSQQAMNNPYSNLLKIGYHDFIDNPVLKNTITDTHFDNPDRRGRLVTFLARLMTDYGFRSFGIACEEYTAVCIDENYIAYVFGYYPNYEDYAYFLQANCEEPDEPEVCKSGEPLTWNRNEAAVKVYKVAGTTTGNHYFNLNNWKDFDGSGTWENWWVDNAVFNSQNEIPPPPCELTTMVTEPDFQFRYFPNPSSGMLIISAFSKSHLTVTVTDLLGRVLIEKPIDRHTVSMELDVSQLLPGAYLLKAESGKMGLTFILLRK